ncbi:MAG: PilW family protein [Thiohalocapsa sp.]
MHATHAITPNRQHGISIVELLVAMIIGLFLVSGVLGLFITNKGVYTNTVRATELQENGRFALGYLLNDLRHAYFFGGKHFDSFELHGDSETPSNADVENNCSGVDAVYHFNEKSLPGSLPLHGSTATSSSAIGCIDDAMIVNGIPSDILILKLARPQPLYNLADLVYGDVYVASNRLSGMLRLFTADTTMPSLSPSCSGRTDQCLPYGAYWKYQFRAYYIRAPARDGEPPTLTRMTMKWDATDGMKIVPEDLVEGVEGMRFLYGVSTDGQPAIFQQASDVTNWNDVVSVQVHLLLRNTLPNSSYRDTSSYQMGDVSVTATKGSAASQGAKLRNFHRTVVSTTVMLRNKPMVED